MSNLSIKSYAKVNLFLHVLGRRGDGYHDIYTLFCAVDLFDTLTLSSASSVYMVCNRTDVPTDERNTVLKVDKILRDEYGLKRQFKIELYKTVPVGAGLGGGSSNAAAYLTLVNEVAGIGLDKPEMCRILERVGSDTCFFLHLPMALGEGRGEKITPIGNGYDFSVHLKQADEMSSLSGLWILIVSPNIFVSTAAVYANKKVRITDRTLLPKIAALKDIDGIAAVMVNDLESAVFDVCPVSEELCLALERAGSLKAMASGSGSSVFGVFRDRKARDTAYDIISKQYPGYTAFKTSALCGCLTSKLAGSNCCL